MDFEMVNSDAGTWEGPRGATGPPIFGRSVNPFPTRGDRLCPPNYYWHTLIFRPSDGPATNHF